MISILQSNEQRGRTIREKSQNFREIVSKRKIMCFKILKLIYNKIIYAKTF